MPDVQFFDPKAQAEVNRRRMMAQMMMKQGQQPDRTEVISGVAVKQSPLAAMAKAIQQGIGGYQAGQADNIEAQDTQKRQELLARAITGLKDDPTGSAQMLLGNPSTSDMGLKLYLGQIEADAQRGQLQDKYAREDSQWQREKDFQREQAAAKAGAGAYRPDPTTGGVVFDPTAQPAGGRDLSATEQREMFEAQEKFDAGQGAMGALKQAQDIYSRGEIDPVTGKEKPGAKPYTGFGADIMPSLARAPLIGNIIADKDRGAATTNASNLVTQQALESLKSTFGGNPTEGERTILLQLQALPTYTPEEQKVILGNAISAANRRAAAEQAKLERIKTGNYFGQPPAAPMQLGMPTQSPMPPPVTPTQNPTDLMDENGMPVQFVNDPVPGLPPAGDNLQQVRNTPPSGAVQIQSDQDYDALPPGTEFIGPDGVKRRKP